MTVVASLRLGDFKFFGPDGATSLPASTASPSLLHEPILEGLSWFTLTPFHPDEVTLAGFDLKFGAIGNGPFDIEHRYGPLESAAYQGGLPFAAGPFGDIVLYGYWDGSTSEIHALSPESGADQRLWMGPMIVHDVVTAGRGESTYFLSIDRETRQPAAISRLDPGQPGVAMELAMLAPGPLDDGSATHGDLALTPNGDQLVLLDCPIDCALRWFAADDGRVVGMAELAGSWRLIGVSDTAIWLAPECGDVPCPLTSVDISTGRTRSIALVCSAAIVLTAGADQTIVSDGASADSCVRDDYVLVRFNALGTASVKIAGFPDRRLGLLDQSNRGFATPQGWVFVGPSGQLTGSSQREGASVLVRVADGARLDVPNLDANPR